MEALAHLESSPDCLQRRFHLDSGLRQTAPQRRFTCWNRQASMSLLYFVDYSIPNLKPYSHVLHTDSLGTTLGEHKENICLCRDWPRYLPRASLCRRPNGGSSLHPQTCRPCKYGTPHRRLFASTCNDCSLYGALFKERSYNLLSERHEPQKADTTPIGRPGSQLDSKTSPPKR